MPLFSRVLGTMTVVLLTPGCGFTLVLNKSSIMYLKIQRVLILRKGMVLILRKVGYIKMVDVLSIQAPTF